MRSPNLVHSKPGSDQCSQFGSQTDLRSQPDHVSISSPTGQPERLHREPRSARAKLLVSLVTPCVNSYSGVKNSTQRRHPKSVTSAKNTKSTCTKRSETLVCFFRPIRADCFDTRGTNGGAIYALRCAALCALRCGQLSPFFYPPSPP